MPQKTIVCLCWHPGSSPALLAGGFTRFFEIARRTSSPLVIIDKYPSAYTSLANSRVTLIKYSVPGVPSAPAPLAAALDRLFSLIAITWHLLQLPKDDYVIYVPFSELPQISLAGVLGKYLLSAPLVLVNLNVNVYSIDRLVNKLTHRLADRVITISRALQSDLAGTGIRAGFVNGVGFTPPAAAITSPKRSGAVYIGRHDPQKGILDLFKIWGATLKLLPASSTARLVTAGDMPPPFKSQIAKLITDLQLADRVSLLGPVSNAHKLQLLREARVCLFPSHHEGWGIVPMEALAVGTPVVVYDLPVYRESIGITPGLHTIKTGDTTSFAKTAARLISQRPKPFLWKSFKTWEEIARVETAIICPA